MDGEIFVGGEEGVLDEFDGTAVVEVVGPVGQADVVGIAVEDGEVEAGDEVCCDIRWS